MYLEERGMQLMGSNEILNEKIVQLSLVDEVLHNMFIRIQMEKRRILRKYFNDFDSRRSGTTLIEIFFHERCELFQVS